MGIPKRNLTATYLDVNGWQETRIRYPRDMFLRHHGYRIESRPRHGPAIWSLGLLHFTFAEALLLTGWKEN